MKTLTDQLANYAAYHRDRRNIATHFVGIPMIVVAVATLLARPAWPVAGWPVSAATLLTLLTVVYYLRLDLRFGAAMALLLGAALAAGQSLAAQSTAVWLGAGVGLFVVGWLFQFVGHVYEGRKPAFVDDLIGLIVGPLFVVAEAAFALGLRGEVLREIEARVGPTRSAGAAARQRS
ncbi:MAG: Mpo1-like protein [Steroidobacteraceae bacterium]